MGCFGIWSESTREKHYDNLCTIDGRIALAGEHASYLPAWQEGAVTSALDAIVAHAPARGRGSDAHEDASMRMLAALSVALACGRSVGFVRAERERSDAGADASARASGEEIYQHICQGCHMPDGRGATRCRHVSGARRKSESRLGAFHRDDRRCSAATTCRTSARSPTSAGSKRSSRVHLDDAADRRRRQLRAQPFRQSLYRRADARRHRGAASLRAHRFKRCGRRAAAAAPRLAATAHGRGRSARLRGVLTLE